MVFARFSHGGKVCSGDYLDEDYENDKEYKRMKDYYLPEEGRVLLINIIN